MAARAERAAARLAALLVMASALLSCAREPAPRPDSEVVVAEVNGAPVTLADLKSEIVSRRGLSSALSPRTATRAEAAEALRRLIEKTIVLAEGARLGVAVPASEVEAEIQRIRADFPPGGLEKALLKEGIEFEAWRSELRRSLLYRRASEAIAAARAQVREEEVERAFRRSAGTMNRPERIRLHQLLFETPETAEKAREMLADGKEPAEAARRAAGEEGAYSEADLGFVTREDLPPEVASELFALPEGGVSRVIRQQDSYCVFRVARKEPARVLSYAAAAPEIREKLLRRRREEAFRGWLAAEVKRASVRVRQDLLDRFTEGAK